MRTILKKVDGFDLLKKHYNADGLKIDVQTSIYGDFLRKHYTCLTLDISGCYYSDGTISSRKKTKRDDEIFYICDRSFLQTSDTEVAIILEKCLDYKLDRISKTHNEYKLTIKSFAFILDISTDTGKFQEVDTIFIFNLDTLKTSAYPAFKQEQTGILESNLIFRFIDLLEAEHIDVQLYKKTLRAFFYKDVNDSNLEKLKDEIIEPKEFSIEECKEIASEFVNKINPWYESRTMCENEWLSKFLKLSSQSIYEAFLLDSRAFVFAAALCKKQKLDYYCRIPDHLDLITDVYKYLKLNVLDICDLIEENHLTINNFEKTFSLLEKYNIHQISQLLKFMQFLLRNGVTSDVELTLSNLTNTLPSLNNLDDNYLDSFFKFLKQLIMIKDTPSEYYVSTFKYYESLKKEKDNFTIRDFAQIDIFNALKSREKVGYDESRLEIAFDFLDIDPLITLELLSQRKKLSKNDKEKYIELLSKK